MEQVCDEPAVQVSDEITESEWGTIHNVCGDCKWIILIELFASTGNKPQYCEHVDTLLQKKFPSKKYRYRLAHHALTYLNGKLHRANVPLRIRRVVKGRTMYDGKIQIVRIDPKAS